MLADNIRRPLKKCLEFLSYVHKINKTHIFIFIVGLKIENPLHKSQINQDELVRNLLNQTFTVPINAAFFTVHPYSIAYHTTLISILQLITNAIFGFFVLEVSIYKRGLYYVSLILVWFYGLMNSIISFITCPKKCCKSNAPLIPLLFYFIPICCALCALLEYCSVDEYSSCRSMKP